MIGPRAFSDADDVRPQIALPQPAARSVPASITATSASDEARASSISTAPVKMAAAPEPAAATSAAIDSAGDESPTPPGSPPPAERATLPPPPPTIIYFASDHDTLDEIAAHALDSLASELANSADSIEIVGHADARGTEHHNDDLSAHRMRRVRDYLETHGVDGARMHGRAAGDREPARDGGDEGALAANRRVEIRRTP
ncbi:MAG TPA: OmpA family protein [Kofleriaceae bacterium]|nr:OmpA family protein [Kofleriaceae bacterium]